MGVAGVSVAGVSLGKSGYCGLAESVCPNAKTVNAEKARAAIAAQRRQKIMGTFQRQVCSILRVTVETGCGEAVFLMILRGSGLRLTRR